MLIADNLAAHDIGGFTTSFSSFRRCRFCNANSDNIQYNFSENNFQLRTPESYDSQVLEIEKNSNLCSMYGIRGNSVLNKLLHFHICWSSPSDIAHDLFEGFCLDLLKVTIQHCIREKLFSLNQLNDAIEQFPYTGRDKSNKPSTITAISPHNINIKQTASQCHNLIALLPLFVARLIPEDDEYWHCFLLFLNCLDYILAPSLNLGHIKHMEDLIEEFLTCYKHLDDSIHIKPKGHFMVHYASQYRKLGPLVHFSTLRYESKHSNLKRMFSSCKNFRNPCMTIATRHQYLQSLHHMEKNFLVEDKSMFGKQLSSVPIFSLDETLQQEIQEISHSQSLIEITCYKSVEHNGITYAKGNVVLYEITEDYDFGLIDKITYLSGSIYLILNICTIIEFNTHLHHYNLGATNKFVLFKVKNLCSPFALPAYKCDNSDKDLLVRLHHFVF